MSGLKSNQKILKDISDCKDICYQEPLVLHDKVLRRWRINLSIIIFLPAIIFLTGMYYIHIKDNASFNPEEDILNESCYLSEFGCCEVVDYCWPNGVKFLQPQHHYYLNLPKEI